MNFKPLFVKAFAWMITNAFLPSTSADAAYGSFQIPKCYDEELLITPQNHNASFAKYRLAFSKFYENWPYLIVEPLTSSRSVGEFFLASSTDMKLGKDAISQTVKCSNANNIKFTARSGGHNNEGASVMNGLLTIDTRGMNRVCAKPKYNNSSKKKISPKERSYWSPGTVSVGPGATAGQALFLSFNETSEEVGSSLFNYAGALPVGQKPSVGMAGLTLGGGFGFMTRFGGFLCDRLISFEAVIPSGPLAGEQITVTKDGPHKDLFWAACGGGGGNFVVVTDFKFDLLPVCPYDNTTKEDDLTIKCTGVVLVKYPVMLNDTEAIEFYQHMSYDIDTRITLNFEVESSTHAMVAGIFLGPWSAFVNSLKKTAGVNETTPLTLSGFMQHSKIMTDFAQAVTDLTGWTNDKPPSILLDAFLDKRTYFKYKSFFLFEPVNQMVIEILQDLVRYEGDDSLVFEFQSLGGGPQTDINKYDPENIYQSPPNNFSSVDPKATAFPHRNARHCLMLKATGSTLEKAESLLQKMEHSFFKLAPHIKGHASYYNHMDVSVPGIDVYFKNGVETNPSVTESEKDYWIQRLTSVRRKYNGDGMLSNLRPCCDDPKTPSPPVKAPVCINDNSFQCDWKQKYSFYKKILSKIKEITRVKWFVRGKKNL